MKGRKGLVLSLVIACFLMRAVPVSAASKSNAGAKIPSYSKVVSITIDKARFDRSFKEALDTASAKASSKVQYKVIIPPGTYTSNWNSKIGSNTYIYAKGATIKLGTSSQFFTSRIDKKTKNIVIDGGTWTTYSQNKDFKAESAPFRFLGVTNLVMKNMTIKCNRRAHIIEVADMNGFTVKDCKIEGSGRTSSSVQNKEAIQLDVATADAMPSYTTKKSMLNGKGCHSVLIKNCRFTKCQRGVGSHSGIYGKVEKKPYTNIIVESCTFKYLKGEGVFAQNWRYCTIKKNTIYTCRRAGVYMLDAYSVKVDNNKITDVRKLTGSKRTTYGSDATGVLVWRSTGNTITNNKISKYSVKTVVLDAVSGKNTVKGNKGTNKR